MQLRARDIGAPFSPINRQLVIIESRLLQRAQPVRATDVLIELMHGLNSLTLEVEDEGQLRLVEFPVVAEWFEDDFDNVITAFHWGQTENQSTRFSVGTIAVGEQPSNQRRLHTECKEIVRRFVTSRKPGEDSTVLRGDEADLFGSLSIPRYLGLTHCWRFEQMFNERQLHLVLFLKVYPEGVPYTSDLNALRNAFETAFVAPACSHYPSLVRDLAQADSSGVPSLQTILSSFQSVCEGSRHLEGNEDPVGALHDAFRVFFNRPVLYWSTGPDQRTTLNRGFKYEVTAQQEAALRRLSETPDGWRDNERMITQRIAAIRQTELEQLVKCAVHLGVVRKPLEADEDFLRRSMQLIERQWLAADSPERGEGRAFLRTGGMWLYVYAESAVRTLLDKVRDSTLLRDLAKERIPLEQAELIGQILSSGHPDTIEGPFITHPLSTLETKRILEATHLYPAYIHLAERLLFPKRFFMQPVYFRAVPVMVLGTDADWIAGRKGEVSGFFANHAGTLLLRVLYAELEDLITDFTTALKHREDQVTAKTAIQHTKQIFDEARHKLAFHFYSENIEGGRPPTIYSTVPDDIEKAWVRFSALADLLARRETAWLYNMWLAHEASNWKRRLELCADVIANSAEATRSGPFEVSADRIRAFADVIVWTTQLFKPNSSKPLTPRQFQERIKTLYLGLIWRPCNTEYYSSLGAASCEIPAAVFSAAVELIRNAAAAQSATIKTALRVTRGHVELEVLSEPQPRTVESEIERRLAAVLPAGEEWMATDDRGLGLPLLQTLLAKLGGKLKFDYEPIDALYVRVIARARVPI